MRFTDSYGEQSCTAGRASFITGQSVFRTGLSKVGMPGAPWHAGRGPDDRRAAQAARLRDRSVRQEPLRRSEQVPADRARLRRVLRQPLPPQRRGGAGGPRLPEGSRSSRSSSGRAACCIAGRPTRTTRPSNRAGAASASRRSRTPARSRASAWRPATTNSSRPPRTSSSGSTRPASRSSVAQHHAHALPHAHQAEEPRPGGR